MTDYKAKETIKTIWKKYARTLKLLDKALDELEKKPKEIIVEVEKPFPRTLEEIANTNEALRRQLDDLIQWRLRAKMYKSENDRLKQIPPADRSVSSDVESQTLDKDYWGRLKKIPTIKAKPSKKNILQDQYIKNLTKKKTSTKNKT